MASIAYLGCRILQASEMPPGNLWDIVEDAAEMTAQPGFSTMAAALVSHQRSAGLTPVLTAVHIRSLVQYSKQQAAHQLLKREPKAPDAQKWLAAALTANSQLLLLEPDLAACLHYKRGVLMDSLNIRPEAVAEYRSALRETSAHQCE